MDFSTKPSGAPSQIVHQLQCSIQPVNPLVQSPHAVQLAPAQQQPPPAAQPIPRLQLHVAPPGAGAAVQSQQPAQTLQQIILQQPSGQQRSLLIGRAMQRVAVSSEYRKTLLVFPGQAAQTPQQTQLCISMPPQLQQLTASQIQPQAAALQQQQQQQQRVPGSVESVVQGAPAIITSHTGAQGPGPLLTSPAAQTQLLQQQIFQPQPPQQQQQLAGLQQSGATTKLHHFPLSQQQQQQQQSTAVSVPQQHPLLSQQQIVASSSSLVSSLPIAQQAQSVVVQSQAQIIQPVPLMVQQPLLESPPPTPIHQHPLHSPPPTPALQHQPLHSPPPLHVSPIHSSPPQIHPQQIHTPPQQQPLHSPPPQLTHQPQMSPSAFSSANQQSAFGSPAQQHSPGYSGASQHSPGFPAGPLSQKEDYSHLPPEPPSPEDIKLEPGSVATSRNLPIGSNINHAVCHKSSSRPFLLKPHMQKHAPRFLLPKLAFLKSFATPQTPAAQTPHITRVKTQNDSLFCTCKNHVSRHKAPRCLNSQSRVNKTTRNATKLSLV